MADNSTVIVAIPSREDKVWKLSSEKVPHMTLLYLGDLSKSSRLGHIESYLEHVVSTSEHRFGMSVDHRGPLGPDEADVLFFDSFGVKKMQEFRSFMLKDPSIFAAYNSVQQYPEWTPHLTLGYPTAPAKEDDSEHPGIRWVHFDRIALWIGDYEGPEFLLKEDGGFGVDPMFHSDDPNNFLAHFGIKGMRWGVRRNDSQLGHPSGAESNPARKVPDHVAVDAERSVHTLNKDDTVEMSTAEMKAAVDRARTVNDYHKFFSQNETPLERQLRELEAKKKIIEIQQMLNPPKKSKVEKFVGAAQKGWSAYSAVDKATGGNLSKGIAKKMGIKEELDAAAEAKALSNQATKSKHLLSIAKNTKELQELAGTKEVKSELADMAKAAKPKAKGKDKAELDQAEKNAQYLEEYLNRYTKKK